ncbi:hypothetical protein QOT17_024137 [Balamuthia mandrillaris]
MNVRIGAGKTAPLQGSAPSRTGLWVTLGAIGVVGVGLAAYYFLSRRSTTNSKPATRVPAGTATITLQMASTMQWGELVHALRKASAAQDKPSQINLLYIMGTLLAQSGVTPTGVDVAKAQEALECYSSSLALAKAIHSELEGPIEIEMALLHFATGNAPYAIPLFEAGLLKYIETPRQVAEVQLTLVSRYLLMLRNCYHLTSSQQRGSQFLARFQQLVAEAKPATQAQILETNIVALLGELCFSCKDFKGTIQFLEPLESSTATAHSLLPELQVSFYAYLGLSYAELGMLEKAVGPLRRYLDMARQESAQQPVNLRTVMCVAQLTKALRETSGAETAHTVATEAMRIIKRYGLEQGDEEVFVAYLEALLDFVRDFNDANLQRDVLKSIISLCKKRSLPTSKYDQQLSSLSSST